MILSSTSQPSKYFEIPEVEDRPTIISAGAAYDAREIRQYNRKRGVKSNISVSRRAQRYPETRGSFWFDPELCKKLSAVERFFS